MMSKKLSQAQRRVLERMAGEYGDTITCYRGSIATGPKSIWFTGDGGSIASSTFNSLEANGYIRYLKLTDTYHITDEGRAIVQAKEAAGEGVK